MLSEAKRSKGNRERDASRQMRGLDQYTGTWTAACDNGWLDGGVMGGCGVLFWEAGGGFAGLPAKVASCGGAQYFQLERATGTGQVLYGLRGRVHGSGHRRKVQRGRQERYLKRGRNVRLCCECGRVGRVSGGSFAGGLAAGGGAIGGAASGSGRQRRRLHVSGLAWSCCPTAT